MTAIPSASPASSRPAAPAPEPVPAEPVLAEPVLAEPVLVQPVAAEPVAPEPVAPEPVAPQQPRAPRVELGFRDGSTAALAPGSEQAEAFTELARILVDPAPKGSA